MKALLKSGLVFGGGSFSVLDIALADGLVTAAERDITPIGFDVVLDLTDKYVLPGLADVHVHLREPGFSYKETVATGTAAAARGGFTTVCAMPNVNPAPDNLAVLLEQTAYAKEHAKIRVVPYACITTGGAGCGSLVDYKTMVGSAAAFSDDGNGVQSGELMEKAMAAVREAGGIIAAHCEDLSLTGGGYIHDGVYAKTHGHAGIPSESEWRQVQRDLDLVRKTGCDYHVCHVSCRESVRLIRQAKSEGLPVTCESAPHYLVFCDEDLRDDGAFKMSPPIRSRLDREALIEGIADGTIDMIATDHAPHSAAEKAGGLAGSLNGVVGLETSLNVMYTELVRRGIIGMERLAALMCTAPRARFGLGRGSITVGKPADLVVFDPKREHIVDPGKFLSMGRAAPFVGRKVFGDVMLTIAEGSVVWATSTFSFAKKKK